MSNMENHDQDEGVSQEGLPILIHVEKYEGGQCMVHSYRKR